MQVAKWGVNNDTPISWDASIRSFQRGQLGYIADALEQPLLLPRDMDAYRHFKQPELFLSLKRDLTMVSNLTYLSIKYLAALLFFLPFFFYV